MEHFINKKEGESIMNVKENGIGVIILLLGLAAMGYLLPAFMALDLPEAYAALLWFLTGVLLVFIVPSIAFGERKEIKEFMSYLATFTGWVVLLAITYTCWGILPFIIVLGIGGFFLMGGIGVLVGAGAGRKSEDKHEIVQDIVEQSLTGIPTYTVRGRDVEGKIRQNIVEQSLTGIPTYDVELKRKKD